MAKTTQRKEEILRSELPPVLPLMALRSTIVYPLGTIAVQMGAPENLALLRANEDPGVIVALVVWPVFGVAFPVALLIGAVLAATDPAILIPLFDRLKLRPKVSQTVIAESAFNATIGAAACFYHAPGA